MSWPSWTAAGTAPIPTAMTASVQPAALMPTAINSAPAVIPPGIQYSPEQWAQAQQQNWQQWAQWQQQYQQWHQQYGAEYQKSMSALQGLTTSQQPPLPGMPNTGIPPPLPAEPKPPLPPEEPPANQPTSTMPSYSTMPPKSAQMGYSTAPPPIVGQQMPGSPIDQYNTQRQSWQSNQQNPNKRPFNQGFENEPNKRPLLDRPKQWSGQKPNVNQWTSQPPPNISYNQPPPQTLSAPKHNIEELSEAEKKFDKEFAAWEAQFNKWKDQNSSHPDKTQYMEYEKKWESWRNSLLERREQMRKKRLAMSSGAVGGNKPVSFTPLSSVQQPVVDPNRPAGFSAGSTNLPSEAPIRPPVTADLINNPPNLSNNPLPHQNNEPLTFKSPEIPEETGEDFLKSTFSSGGGIPGLDLVKEDDGSEQNQKEDVIDIEKQDKPSEEQPLTKGPDFDAISKGINSILGDEKLLSMLSMVSQKPPPTPAPNTAVNPVSNMPVAFPQDHNFSAPPPPHHFNETRPSANFNAPPPSNYQPNDGHHNLPHNEQSNHSYDDKSNHGENYQQRESVNNFDDQTRSSFTMGPNDQDMGFGVNNFSRNQLTRPLLNRFGGESDRGTQRLNFDSRTNNQPFAPNMSDRNKFDSIRGDKRLENPTLNQSDSFKRNDFKRGNNFSNEGFNRDDNFSKETGFKYAGNLNSNNDFKRNNFGKSNNFDDRRGSFGNNFNRSDNFNAPKRYDDNRDNYDQGDYDDYENYNEDDDDYDKYHEMFNESEEIQDIARHNQMQQKHGNMQQQQMHNNMKQPHMHRNMQQQMHGNMQQQMHSNMQQQQKNQGQVAQRPQPPGLMDVPVEAPEPAPEDPIFEPTTVIDYEHKSSKLSEPEVVVEPLHMFDYRHKPLNRIPIPQRPKWLSEAMKFIREFDPLVPRGGPLNFERPQLDRYPSNSRESYRDERRIDTDEHYDTHNRSYDDRPYEGKDRRFANEFESQARGDRKQYRGDGRELKEGDGYSRRERRSLNRGEDKESKYDESRHRFDDNRYNANRHNRDTSKNDFEEFSDDDMNFENTELRKHQQNRDDRGRSRSPILSNPPNPSVRDITMIEDIINAPGRFNRPPRIVIILRGPPGSGKTYLAKLIKDKEVENGGSTPRILSLDDYFMVEHEKEVIEDGKKIKVKEMVYEYEAEMEESYRTSFIKSFKKTITDGYFPFIIVDNVNDKVKYFGEMWSFAKQNGFQVYVCQLDLDPTVCTKRNTHNRSEAEIEECIAGWEPTPNHHPTIDASGFLQSSIADVEMEEVEQAVEEPKTEEVPEDNVRSKWDTFDCSINNLAKLDGVSRPLRPSRTMEDYLQMEHDWEQSKSAKPGQKRVRWADLEEQREQKKMRAIGFIVGHTNWNRMMDPTEGSSALTRTKYI